MLIKLFSDPCFLPRNMNPDPILIPFWGDRFNKSLYPSGTSFTYDAHNIYREIGSSLFEMTSLEEADIALMPMNWRTVRGGSWRSKPDKNAIDLASQFAKKVHQAGKPLIVFFAGDCSDEQIPIDNALVFRMSVYRSKTRSTLPVPPAFIGDQIQQQFQGELPLRHKQSQPVVGYCGFARSASLKQVARTALYHTTMLAKQRRLGVSPNKGQILRSRAIHLLRQSPYVQTNFIVRDRSFFDLKNDPILARQNAAEYFQNILDSDYVLCCRGSANYSIRLFEVLSSGRIPVFINTDCVLPWDASIDWKKYCVWVEENELHLIGEKVMEFHQRLSPGGFIELQHQCRKLWREWLSSEGFYTHFQQYIRQHLTKPQHAVQFDR